MDALRLDVDGTITELTFDPEGSLATLQQGVGGIVDCVALSDSVDMWLHDEAAFIYKVNPVATEIAHIIEAFARRCTPGRSCSPVAPTRTATRYRWPPRRPPRCASTPPEPPPSYLPRSGRSTPPVQASTTVKRPSPYPATSTVRS